MADLSAAVKAYDIRGVVPDELDATMARAVGAAFVRYLDSPTLVVGHDMRTSSPELAAALAEGAASAGAQVTLIGLASTDELYFASGFLDQPGAMITASHNPARYNGIKLCRAGAAPVGRTTGLADIAELALRAGGGSRTGAPGGVSRRDVLTDYARYLTRLVDLRGLRPLTAVVDAANGMAGHTVPAVLGGTTVRVVPLYFELDGTFPHHEANPLDPSNLVDLCERVRQEHADIGLAFDGDADRCFVVDERGEVVSPSAVTALVAVRELARHPGATIIHNLITSRAVPEIVREHGGVPLRTPVGHSIIKAEMARSGAVFGGEHSGHYYFRDFWRADTGMLAALNVLAALGEQEAPLSALMAGYTRYCASGEINSEVDDPQERIEALRAHFADRETDVDTLDGLTLTTADWWLNVRPSNTEPLLRLNVEAVDGATMAAVRDEALGVIRSRHVAPGDRAE